MEVGKSELRAGKPRTFLLNVLEHFQARACPRKGLCDPRFIARSALARIYDALDIDVPNEGAICVGIQDAGGLIHSGACLSGRRLQGRSAERFIDVALDGGCFVKPETVVFECGNAPEGLTQQVVGRRSSRRENVYLDKIVR